MPTLIVEDMPTDVYELLEQRAAAGQRSLPDETVRVLQQALRTEACPTPRLPELIPGEEVSAPCDLPRSSRPVTVSAGWGQPRLPDPPVAQSPE